jgi:hypothetical protein
MSDGDVTPVAEAARVRLGRARASCRDLLAELGGSGAAKGLIGSGARVDLGGGGF